MENVHTVTFAFQDKHVRNAGPVTAYHHHILSSVLPDFEHQHQPLEKKDKVLESNNDLLKRKNVSLMAEAERFKAERQRFEKLVDQQRKELIQHKDELSVLVKKIKIQNTDLRRSHKQNEDLKEKLDSTKKELQLLKQSSVAQRAEQQKLKVQLDQVIKERDNLNSRWCSSKTECSKLRDKIISQKLSMNKSEIQCKKMTKEIQLLKLENEKLRREMGIKEKDAAYQTRVLRKCEDQLQRQNTKLRDQQVCQEIGTKNGERIIVVYVKPLPEIKNPSQQELLRWNESLQKELLTQNKELRKTLKLTQVAVQFQTCQAAARDQKDQLKAVTAQRNMYKRNNKGQNYQTSTKGALQWKTAKMDGQEDK